MVSTRSVKKRFNLNVKFPWFSYHFKEDGRRRFVVDFMVPLLNKKHFCPFVTRSGESLHLHTMLPEFFFDQDRLLDAFSDDTDFNKNNHCNTSYEDLLKEINKERSAKKELYSSDIIIKLPFKVEESELKWKLLIFESDECKLAKSCNNSFQSHAILLVEVPSIEREKTPLKEGGVRIIKKSADKRRRGRVADENVAV